MAFLVKPSRDFVLCPEGLHGAICTNVEDLGIVAGVFGQKHKVRIVWQIDGVNPQTGAPYEAVKHYNVTLHAKATLRRDLEGWRGAKFTPADLVAFDLEQLVGRRCQVNVVHVTGDDGITYANVETVVPMPRQAPRAPTRPRVLPTRAA